MLPLILHKNRRPQGRKAIKRHQGPLPLLLIKGPATGDGRGGPVRPGIATPSSDAVLQAANGDGSHRHRAAESSSAGGSLMKSASPLQRSIHSDDVARLGVGAWSRKLGVGAVDSPM